MRKSAAAQLLSTRKYRTSTLREYQATTLARKFYEGDPRRVAPALLGKLVVRRDKRELLVGRIVETEAYLGARDAAAHAAAGETARNRVLFGPPGHAYVYFTYGMHYCLNVSCMPAGDAGCVLVRALEPLTGLRTMALARDLTLENRRLLCSGPARLCEAFGITRERDNGKDLTVAQDLWIADDGFEAGDIVTTTRIGITKSPELPLRFYLRDNEFVSRRAATREKSLLS